MEFAEMTAVGAAQSLTGLVNLIPGVNVPSPPKYEDEVKQAGANIAGDLALTLAGARLITGLGGFLRGSMLPAPVLRAIRDPFVQRTGEALGTHGSGILATAASPGSTDHNLSGTLKKHFLGIVTGKQKDHE